MAGTQWTAAEDDALCRIVEKLSKDHRDKASLYTAVALQLSRETQKARTRQTVSDRYHAIISDAANDQLNAPEHESTSRPATSARRGIPKPVKRVPITASDGGKRRQEGDGEVAVRKKRVLEPGVVGSSSGKKRKIEPVTARADSTTAEDLPETAVSRPAAGITYPKATTLARLQCELSREVEVCDDPTLFRVPLMATTEYGEREGFCLLPTESFRPPEQEAIRSRKYRGLHHDHLQCHATLVRIDEEAEDDYVVAIKVSYLGQELDGGLRIPNLEICGELLSEWLATRGEAILESVEEGPNVDVEEANKYNRTVHIIGNMTIGERRSSAIRVEV
ncbi:hypothetical protein LTR85_000820 [Meristemomyces frigidus]|nr:hypothetical protein LTR85_000820 [Meristemomyces frigidus]